MLEFITILKIKTMTHKEFIETYIKIKIKDKEKSIKLSPVQCAFLDWVVKCKKKRLKPFILKGRGRI